MLSLPPPRIVFIVLIPIEKSAWSIPVSCYLMRRIAQFLQVMGPDQTTVCRFPLQIDRSSSRRFSSPRSSSSYIIILTLQITQEEIDVMTRSGWPKLDNLDYLFWNSSIRCSWTWCTHVIQSPTLFVRVLLLTGLGDDGLDLCFSLLLACPY